MVVASVMCVPVVGVAVCVVVRVVCVHVGCHVVVLYVVVICGGGGGGC